MIINYTNNTTTALTISEVDFPELEQSTLDEIGIDFSVDYSTKDWENDYTKSYEWDY